MSTEGKVYLNIVKEIDRIINHDELAPGDKLPSERELAERLQAGRSSVREALRALELLDLIETRKGEGTFIKAANSQQLIELLANFFLRDPKARKDVTETRRVIETEAVRLGCSRATEEQKQGLAEIVAQSFEKMADNVIPYEEDYQFHKALVETSGNRLLINIWRPLLEYSKVALKASLEREGRIEQALYEHEEIVHAIFRNQEDTAVSALQRHLSNSQF
ncbi:FadR/GntR family transcriptional regulator [Salisediminibacterium halotolerans]|uniref:GntR family transcriptional regulator, transcriptional repressor for pyruvate dehydrogenase complex n=1 Tax=Salisediminibacterium halotolerans TaxID=517425 RepID=A0A1H9V6A5_9BACI|nr:MULTISPECIES: FadR/GntR family transcriptional regulator [Salisediminibacterium]RLJ69354.1 GntR family transcriptional regulator [Actinophytocola xinjiangensis]RPE84020.1 GntR family transcriptional regulator [Salisediminibacterium halotolerans]TWG32429.1 GntR family transcriptional regulator [Salisediminibacterium halotolerans]SES16924.1 GntR family transcriptional regulator, transcriptional repressor for pyruvate dehydrogenase complex [Salisediminibacterium haloalkalitolerans]GEL07353.1 G